MTGASNIRRYHSHVATPDLITQFRAARADPALAVLEGFHAIKHAIRFDAEFVAIASRNVDEVTVLARHLAPDVQDRIMALATSVSADVYSALSPTPPDTGVIAIARRRITPLDELLSRPADAPIVLLESPSHSGNIGAVIRVAAGAGAAAVVTTGSNDPWNPGAIRGAAGLHFALPVIRAGDPEFGDRPVIAIDPEGDELHASSIPPGAVLAFGSERAGVTPALLARASRRVRIPMEQGVSSLNLATAVAVVLYAWRLR